MSQQPPGPQGEEETPGGTDETPVGYVGVPPSSDYMQQPTGGAYTTPPASGSTTPPEPESGYMPPPAGGYTPPPTTPGGGYTPPPAPPAGGYAPPPPPPPSGGGFNVGGMDQAGMQNLVQSYINAITKPNVSTFEGELRNGTWSKVLIGVAAVAIINFITGLIGLGGYAGYMKSFGSVNSDFATNAAVAGGIGAAFGGFVFTFIAFFAGAALLYLSARIFGGQGSDFLTHSYLLSLSYTPLRIIASVLGIIPCVGGIVGLVAVLYQLYLAGLSMQASQRMQAGRAQAAAWVPALIVGVLAVLCAIVAAASLIAIFSSNR